jgi:hypothetical protein
MRFGMAISSGTFASKIESHRSRESRQSHFTGYFLPLVLKISARVTFQKA